MKIKWKINFYSPFDADYEERTRFEEENILLDSALDKIRSDGRVKKGGLIKREIKLGMYLGIGNAVRSGKIFQEHGTMLLGETRWDKRVHRTISRE